LRAAKATFVLPHLGRAVTRRPFSQPVVFTYQVLHDLGQIRTSTPLSFQVRSTFHGCRTGQLTQRRGFSGLAAARIPGFPPDRARDLPALTLAPFMPGN
jgi:hypothetical protein